jgi:hypothetical protein
MWFPNGEKYTGEFLDGEFNGKGKLRYVDDSYYEGQFLNGFLNGKGTFYIPNLEK